MRYLITGGSGFIGTALCRALAETGAELTVLTRDPARARLRLPEGVRLVTDLARAGGADVAINLAGENLAQGRWSEARKRLLRDSRIATTRALCAWIERQSPRPRVLVSASAIGYYGARGDEPLDENAAPGEDYAARLCRDWEAEALRAEPFGLRVCRLRLGVVLDRDGGALARMLPAFRWGLGGPIASGRQWLSWIHRSDVVALIRWCVDRPTVRGAYNATAPHPVTNAEFARALGRALQRPAFLRMPATALKLLLGEMAQLLITGQRVLPARLLAEGFAFSFPELSDALVASLR
ncbi:MAG: TIGR01777 family oxidoreductase [Sinobacteraceae bacterium]|nr:TIGR01777 family oxidoreductase [Nevskiaceae bacterium]